MGINYFSEDIEFEVQQQEKLSEWIAKAIVAEKNGVGDINFIFTSDAYLLKMNKEYLQHNYYTDVITFDYTEEKISGDIFISIHRLQDNANEYKVSFEDELRRVMIHGVLHLIGYNDATAQEKQAMRQKEDNYLLHWNEKFND